MHASRNKVIEWFLVAYPMGRLMHHLPENLTEKNSRCFCFIPKSLQDNLFFCGVCITRSSAQDFP